MGAAVRKWVLLCVCMKRVFGLVFIFVFRGNECSKSMPNKRNYESCVSGPNKKKTSTIYMYVIYPSE